MIFIYSATIRVPFVINVGLSFQSCCCGLCGLKRFLNRKDLHLWNKIIINSI